MVTRILIAIFTSYLLAVRLKFALGELLSRAQYSWRVRETIYGFGKNPLCIGYMAGSGKQGDARMFDRSWTSGSHDLPSGLRECCVKQNWRDGLLAERP